MIGIQFLWVNGNVRLFLKCSVIYETTVYVFFHSILREKDRHKKTGKSDIFVFFLSFFHFSTQLPQLNRQSDWALKFLSWNHPPPSSIFSSSMMSMVPSQRHRFTIAMQHPLFHRQLLYQQNYHGHYYHSYYNWIASLWWKYVWNIGMHRGGPQTITHRYIIFSSKNRWIVRKIFSTIGNKIFWTLIGVN